MIVLRNEDYYLYVEETIVYSGNNGRPQYNYGIHLHSITKEEAEIVNETNYRDYMLKRDWITLVCEGHEGFPDGWLKAWNESKKDSRKGNIYANKTGTN